MKTLQKILCMPDKELGNYLLHQLKKYYPKIETDRDNYIYAKGPGEICLVAHIDTVRGKTDEPVMLSINRNVIKNVKGVLGADDRAGVYGILEVLKSCVEYNIKLPSVVFTNYEESGGRGVKKFIAAKKFKPEGIKLLLELDRKGCNEYVYYSTTLPKPVKEYIESFGFKEERGSYSDIADLTNEYLIPSVNLSVGYYAQHTGNERLHYDELLMTIDRVVDICADPIPALHTVEKPLYGNYRSRHFGGGHDYYGGEFGDYGHYGYYNAAANRKYENDKKTSGGVTTIPTTTEVVRTVVPAAPKGSAESVVANIILNLKDEIKSELLSVYTLDAIGQRFFNHEHCIMIIEKLGEIEDLYYGSMYLGKKDSDAFNNMWAELTTSSFYKLNPKVVTNALATVK